MLKTLKQKPLLASLLIVLLYACWFLSPLLFGTSNSNLHGTKAMASAGIPELITASVLILFVTMLGQFKVHHPYCLAHYLHVGSLYWVRQVWGVVSWFSLF